MTESAIFHCCEFIQSINTKLVILCLLFKFDYTFERCGVAVKFSNLKCNYSFSCLTKAEKCYFLKRCACNRFIKTHIPINLKMFCLGCLGFNCVYSFFHKMMKFYNDICSARISRTSAEQFYLQIDVISVVKYNRNAFNLLKYTSMDFFKLQCANSNAGTEMHRVKFSTSVTWRSHLRPLSLPTIFITLRKKIFIWGCFSRVSLILFKIKYFVLNDMKDHRD